MGRLKSQTNPTNETITYSYDGVGNIVEIQTPQSTITKTYDALNRLETVTDSSGIITYSYDAIGRQTQVDYSNGLKTKYVYDSRNRVTNIEHKKSDGTVLQSFVYRLDAVGNRTQECTIGWAFQPTNTARCVDYEYNSVHQLVKETVTDDPNDPNGNNTSTTFTYDAVGNLKTKTIDGTSTSYTYNENDQLTDNTTFTYDDNGNLVAKDSTTYEYDDKNRLIKTTTPSNTIEYSYDANDNRIAKTTNDGTTTYLIDANTAYAQVIDGTSIEYTYGNDLLTQNKDAETLLYLTDALGSTRALADSTGSITDNYTYSPYGALLEHLGSSDNSFLFTGEQYGFEEENYYLRARYYSPNSGRFLTRDTYDGTLDSPLSQNHYLYAGSSPSMYVDPSGNTFTMAQVSFGMATIGAFGAVALPKMVGRNTINSGLFKIFVAGGIGQFSISSIGMYIAQAIANNPSLAQELERERIKEAQRVDRRRKNRKVVYHYTDRLSAMLISVTGQLKVTPKHSSGAPAGAYATDIEPWNGFYTQRELSQLFYGGSIHRDVSWFVAIDASSFICRFGTRECYVGGAGGEYAPIHVITIGKNLMLPDRR